MRAHEQVQLADGFKVVRAIGGEDRLDRRLPRSLVVGLRQAAEDVGLPEFGLDLGLGSGVGSRQAAQDLGRTNGPWTNGKRGVDESEGVGRTEKGGVLGTLLDTGEESHGVARRVRIPASSGKD